MNHINNIQLTTFEQLRIPMVLGILTVSISEQSCNDYYSKAAGMHAGRFAIVIVATLFRDRNRQYP